MPLVTRKSLLSLGLLALAAVVLAGAFLWSGLYDIGADDHHSRPVYAALETLRDRSIATRAKALTVPDLTDAALIRQGAGNYDAMCTGCHLAPEHETDRAERRPVPGAAEFQQGSDGLARAPLLGDQARHQASGMPAWGKSMDDRYIWGLVALVQHLPKLDAAQYRALVAEERGHSHGGVESGATEGIRASARARARARRTRDGQRRSRPRPKARPPSR
jgi:mono/diheme cytochrome c family protein